MSSQPGNKKQQKCSVGKDRELADDPSENVSDMSERIRRLEMLVVEIGTHTGQANVVRSHGYKPLRYVKKDKYGAG